MLNKLRMLGIGGKLLAWIREFLSGRTMSVKVAGKMSSLKQVTNSVPQGPVLVPVFLFLLTLLQILFSVNGKLLLTI